LDREVFLCLHQQPRRLNVDDVNRIFLVVHSKSEDVPISPAVSAQAGQKGNGKGRKRSREKEDERDGK
jgi:hypothetical protein